MIRAPENRRLTTVGTACVSQLGNGWARCRRRETALALARELAGEWQASERSDFAWLIRSSGITWSRGI
jgi:hypothetical protein